MTHASVTFFSISINDSYNERCFFFGGGGGGGLISLGKVYASGDDSMVFRVIIIMTRVVCFFIVSFIDPSKSSTFSVCIWNAHTSS